MTDQPTPENGTFPAGPQGEATVHADKLGARIGLIDRLRSCPELMEKMGLEWFEPSKVMLINDVPIDFEEDDYFGSATFVVRGLKVLRDINLVPHLRAYNNCWWCGQDWENTALPLSPTMSQAVGEALYAVFADAPLPALSDEVAP